MTAGWVAGSVRAKALARRRLGAGAARRLAASASLGDALRLLTTIPSGANIRPDQPLAAAQHEIAGTLLWDLRVLAGWLPRDGVRLLRTLGAWFELANVDELLQALAGRPAGAEFRLGALATAWPRLSQATSHDDLRSALAASAWQDPGGQTARAVRLGMRARWAARVAELGDPAASWAAGAAALLVAGERFAAGHAAEPAALNGALRLIGWRAARAVTFGELVGSLPPQARWALTGISSPDGLWRAEATVISRVDQDGQRLLRASGLGQAAVLGAVAVMACDAWRIRAALGLAARGGTPLEAYDELAPGGLR
jgi:hypothetical protein